MAKNTIIANLMKELDLDRVEANELYEASICPGCSKYIPDGDIVDQCPHCKAKLDFATGGGQSGFILAE